MNVRIAALVAGRSRHPPARLHGVNAAIARRRKPMPSSTSESKLLPLDLAPDSPWTTPVQRLASALFSSALAALGLLTALSRDFAYDWQPVSNALPYRAATAVLCGLFMVVLAAALLIRRTEDLAAQLLLPFLLVWFALKVPAVIAVPNIEGVWLGLGEIGMLLGGGWVLFARLACIDRATFFGRLTGAPGLRIARILLGLAIIPVGLGHLCYADVTASLVPAWLPFRLGLAYLTGVAQIVCGLGLTFSILPRVAAWAETTMLTLFAFLVWGPDSWFSPIPKLAGTPSGPRFPLTAFLITCLIAASSLLVASTLKSKRRAGI